MWAGSCGSESPSTTSSMRGSRRGSRSRDYSATVLQVIAPAPGSLGRVRAPVSRSGRSWWRSAEPARNRPPFRLCWRRRPPTPGAHRRLGGSAVHDIHRSGPRCAWISRPIGGRRATVPGAAAAHVRPGALERPHAHIWRKPMRATTERQTNAPAGRMMVQMLGVFAEFERATIIEATTFDLAAQILTLRGKDYSHRTSNSSDYHLAEVTKAEEVTNGTPSLSKPAPSPRQPAGSASRPSQQSSPPSKPSSPAPRSRAAQLCTPTSGYRSTGHTRRRRTLPPSERFDHRQGRCPRQDSNLRTRFRKPMLYPLSYGGNSSNLQDLKQTSEFNAFMMHDSRT